MSVRVQALNGYQGLILLGFLYPAGGGPNAAAAGVCISIDSNNFSTTETFKGRLQNSQNPCDLETTPKLIAAGNYEIQFGVYTPGQQTPQQCAIANVTVAGNQEVVFPKLGACP